MTLTAKQINAICLLAAGRSSKSVAEEIGVTPQTLSDWRRKPAFEAEFNRVKSEVLSTTVDLLRSASGIAVEQLANLAVHASGEETRRKASVDILTLAGIGNPASPTFRFGIGPLTTEECYDRQQQNLYGEKLVNDILGITK